MEEGDPIARLDYFPGGILSLCKQLHRISSREVSVYPFIGSPLLIGRAPGGRLVLVTPEDEVYDVATSKHIGTNDLFDVIPVTSGYIGPKVYELTDFQAVDDPAENTRRKIGNIGDAMPPDMENEPLVDHTDADDAQEPPDDEGNGDPVPSD